MTNNQKFITIEDIGQFAGAGAAVIAVSAVANHLFGVDSTVVAFSVALLLTYANAGIAGTLAPLPWRKFPNATFWKALVGWIMPAVNAMVLVSATLGVLGVAEITT